MAPLFAAQKAMYFYEKLNPNTTTYHHTAAMAISGELDEQKFFDAVNLLIQRHEVLRSSIVENDHDISLVAAPYSSNQNPANLAIKIIKAHPPTINKSILKSKVENIDETLKTLQQKSIIDNPFNMQTGPLWRGALLKFSKKEYQLLFVFHHLIMDISSQNIIMRDLSEIYNALVENRIPELPPIPQLAEIMPIDETQKKLPFWENKLKGLTTLSLQADYPPQYNFHFVGNRIHFELNAKTIDAFKDLANKYDCSLNNIILTSIYAMLYRYTSETDICIGIASANRRGFAKDVNNLVNCFVNSVPARLSLDKDVTFAEFLPIVSENLKEALENQLPLDEVISNALSADIKASTNVASPFNILCNFNNEKTALTLRNTRATPPIELNLYHTKFENFGINFDMLPDGSCRAFLEFNSERFQQQTMQGFVKHLQRFWEKIIENPCYKISDVPILTDEEISLLNKVHDTQKETPRGEFFQSMFSRVAGKNYQKTAIVFHGADNNTSTISFGELDYLTDNLAAYLINLGVGPEKTVGVSITRSINLIVAIVAILKAGGVVVPLETSIDSNSFRDSLLFHKLGDSLIDLVLVDKQTKDLFSSYKKINRAFFTLNVDDASYLKLVKQMKLSYQQPRLAPENLAYIMYTSGTTGVPKGVMIEHATLTNLIYSIRDRKIPLGSKVLCTAPPTFDCFIFELIEGWLGTEGEIHLINEKERLLPSVLENIIRNYQINCATLLPDIIKNLDPKTLPSLIDVICMGATPNEEILDMWYDLGIVIRNEYGPTEGTICRTVNPYKKGLSHANIGNPIANTNIYILDENYRECPIGIPGQLYLSGGLARGYVGKTDLTSEKFPTMFFNTEDHSFSPIEPMEIDEAPRRALKKIEVGKSKRCHPYDNPLTPLDQSHVLKKRKLNPAHSPNKIIRLYKTGDLGCYAEDGSIIFLGRTDRQVKIHGIRIELEGMEALLQKHPLIKTVFIKLNETKDALIAYVVAKSDIEITKEDIDEYLTETSVPLAAWPRLVIQLNEMPINKNGKIDVKALPAPPQNNQPVTLPQTQLQSDLCEIWAKVLRIKEVDINKTFRQHGGDSLSLATLETKLNQQFPAFAKVSFSILNRDINIIQLEAAIKTHLAVPNFETQTKPMSLVATNGTLFSGGKVNSLIFKPIRISVQASGEAFKSFRK